MCIRDSVTAAAQTPALFVVAAGVTHYRDHSFDDGVKFASADAGALVARLQAQGQGLFSRVTPYPLYDDKVTRESIKTTIAEAASHIQPSDVFVLYLAGHGTAIDGKYYFIPWEVRYTSCLLYTSIDTFAPIRCRRARDFQRRHSSVASAQVCETPPPHPGSRSPGSGDMSRRDGL